MRNLPLVAAIYVLLQGQDGVYMAAVVGSNVTTIHFGLIMRYKAENPHQTGIVTFCNGVEMALGIQVLDAKLNEFLIKGSMFEDLGEEVNSKLENGANKYSVITSKIESFYVKPKTDGAKVRRERQSGTSKILLENPGFNLVHFRVKKEVYENLIALEEVCKLKFDANGLSAKGGASVAFFVKAHPLAGTEMMKVYLYTGVSLTSFLDNFRTRKGAEQAVVRATMCSRVYVEEEDAVKVLKISPTGNSKVIITGTNTAVLECIMPKDRLIIGNGIIRLKAEERYLAAMSVLVALMAHYREAINASEPGSRYERQIHRILVNLLFITASHIELGNWSDLTEWDQMTPEVGENLGVAADIAGAEPGSAEVEPLGFMSTAPVEAPSLPAGLEFDMASVTHVMPTSVEVEPTQVIQGHA
jgi:hypothetical protein